MDQQRSPRQDGRLADPVAGQQGPEAHLERLQREKHRYHLSHVCRADVMCWLQCHMDEKCAKRHNALVTVC